MVISGLVWLLLTSIRAEHRILGNLVSFHFGWYPAPAVTGPKGKTSTSLTPFSFCKLSSVWFQWKETFSATSEFLNPKSQIALSSIRPLNSGEQSKTPHLILLSTWDFVSSRMLPRTCAQHLSGNSIVTALACSAPRTYQKRETSPFVSPATQHIY